MAPNACLPKNLDKLNLDLINNLPDPLGEIVLHYILCYELQICISASALVEIQRDAETREGEE